MLRLTCDGLDPLDLDAWDDGIIDTEVQVGEPTVRDVAFDRPGSDGNVDLTQHVSSRAVTVSLTLGESPHSRRALLDRMSPFMVPSRRVTLHMAPGSDPARRLLCRPDPTSVSWQNPAVVELAWSFRSVGSPWWLGEARTVDLSPMPPPPGFTFPLSFPLSFPPLPPGYLIEAFHAGTIDADWTWTVDGPVTSPSLRNEATGEAVQLTGLTLLAGQQAVVDSASRRVTVDGQSRFAAVDFDSTVWWKVPAGRTVVVSMPVAAFSNPAAGVLSFSDSYLY